MVPTVVIYKPHQASKRSSSRFASPWYGDCQSKPQGIDSLLKRAAELSSRVRLDEPCSSSCCQDEELVCWVPQSSLISLPKKVIASTKQKTLCRLSPRALYTVSSTITSYNI